MLWRPHAFVVVIIVALILWASWLLTSLNEVRSLNKKLTVELNNQIAITTNAFQSMRVINDIARINSETRQRKAVDSEATQAAIKTHVVNLDCASRIIPNGAVVELQQHTNRIRSGSSHSDTPSPTR
ncbi:hypothetical protein QE197_14585 [Arsenophonus nasoniae]|uniref:DUF2570 domain-containing protein n=1 Tax=Arsenophonus nasoniae TaxID=638 RepID=A0A4P7KXK9_9GAMM|nr:hypothetical protein [Arsenophonus nasoniae]QBY44736.1 hypothetical protein ArsFIN_33220 [Arsenophonus nasoniae]WGM04958.1 hypothetical protein QE258_15415 [Arsenophonus nasoniae]WGM10059.1 hypothetical protein QE197_14585 [Arsenophonus nasoniae]WGM14774.1 hypothetical protein QE193_14495 [Arsenophonus nasoniae]